MSSVELRAILRDEISAGLKGIRELEVGKAGRESGDSIGKGPSVRAPIRQGVWMRSGAKWTSFGHSRDAMRDGSSTKSIRGGTEEAPC